ncbi:MAG: ATPase, T2SS/T4P/T4SS family [Planctomycetota bacterium]
MPATMIPAFFQNALPLAALPERGGYFSIVSIILFMLCIVLWAYSAAWVRKDMQKNRAIQGPWVAAVCGAGALCLVVWLVVPIFWIGLILFAAGFGGTFIAFAVKHNGKVAPARSILTKAHLDRVMKGSKKGPAKTNDTSKDRTRIKNHEGKAPKWPTDPAERDAYRALQDLMFDAIWRRASDVRLDLVPGKPVKVVYKVDGVERAREPVVAELGPGLFKHFKKIAGMDPEEHRRPQEGSFKAAIGAEGKSEKAADVGAKTLGSTAGQRIILKLFTEASKFRLPDIGLTQPQLNLFEKLVAAPKGVLICGGPRGSGTTSTLYAILRSHDVFMKHIHTLETAKAMDLENITQHVFDSKASEVAFGKRFRSILRMEPDICMASDIPDAETAANAAAAAKQGKKVYLGMQARDCFSALRHYLQGVGDPAAAASSLLAICNQRLVRVLCPECRRAYKPDPKLLKKGNLPMDENRPFYRPPNPNEIEVDKQGNQLLCPVCQGSGYLGRTGVFELLYIDSELRSLIAKGTPLPTLKVEARKKKMRYLQEVALQKVYDGMTSINEVLRVTKEGAAKTAKS